MKNGLVRARVTVRGRVQGVFFRAETRGMALELGVQGWVRNLPDGSVEAAFEGDRDAVEKAVDWCRSGPAGAHVDSIDVVMEKPVGEDGFKVRY